jgi:hydroxyquinol 1,2-dioxygenase
MISAPGYETLITHLFAAGDPYLDSDAVFGVKDSLIREFTHEAPGTAPDGRKIDISWRRLSYDFGLKLLPQTVGRVLNV